MTVEFLKGMSSGILIVMLAVAVGAVITARTKEEGAPRRPLAERLVDAMYGKAMRAAARAVAADRALCAYRNEIQQIKAVHRPGYKLEASWDSQ
jgi:hypothetical protein